MSLATSHRHLNLRRRAICGHEATAKRPDCRSASIDQVPVVVTRQRRNAQWGEYRRKGLGARGSHGPGPATAGPYGPAGGHHAARCDGQLCICRSTGHRTEPVYPARRSGPARLNHVQRVCATCYHWVFDATAHHLAVTIKVAVQWRMAKNSSEVVREADLASLDLGFSPTWLFGPELRSGEVVRLLPHFSPRPLPIHAVYSPSRRHSAEVSAFIQHMRQGLMTLPYGSAQRFWNALYRSATRSTATGSNPDSAGETTETNRSAVEPVLSAP